MRLSNYINEDKQKELILLIGLPASGKSTYISKLKGKFIIISNDLYVEKIAKKMKLTYTEAFNKIGRDDTLNNTRKEFDKAIKKNINIVIDNTNMNKKERSYFVNNVPKDYKKIAIIFKISDSELKKRLDKRGKETGKTIPDEVIKNMKTKYEPPSRKEGFDEIKTIS